MKIRIAHLVVLLAASTVQARTTVSFDRGWRFSKGDAPGAEKTEYLDSSWRVLDVPHDWSIEGPFDAKNPTGGAGGFLPAGVGWYRKAFTLPVSQARQRVFIEFDGIMANSDVWINGFHLGKRPYGYVSFRYELTGHLHFGTQKQNVIAVRADNSPQPASRWYTGAGIYRHVRLISMDAVHLDHWSTFITTPKPDSVQVETSVVNQSNAKRQVNIEVSILGPDGKSVAKGATAAQSVEAGGAAAFRHAVAVGQPLAWSLERPALYRAIVRVTSGTTALDEEALPFGIREFRFDPDTGFWLNGRNFKIKGVCLHHDAGGLGAAVPLRAWERRLETLKLVGVNAIRTAHNPPAPEFLDLCDRMGMLVMDEVFDCWTVAKNPYDYHLHFREWSAVDTRDTVRRDRNHPSIVVYSAGNEIHDTPKPELAKSILKELLEVFHREDPTRPVTQALFRPNVSHDYDNGLADMLDVVGQNYRENEILAAHAAKPSRKILGTENQHGRGVWLALRDNAAYAGQFLWSGIDYLGESRAWPVVAAGSGLLDHTGAMKPMAYERQSWWSDRPMVYIARRVAPRQAGPVDPGYEAAAPRPIQTLRSDWTPSDGTPHEENVEVYSNCDEVELLLNGVSLGKKPLPRDAAPRTWRVPFAPGTLRAVGFMKGNAVATHEVRTAGKAARIALSVDKKRLAPDWDDVSYVTASVVDEQGVRVPGSNPEIVFHLEGAGVIRAVDSADNGSHEAFQASRRRAYDGWCVAIVQASRARGSISVTASAEGLESGSARIEIEGGK